MRDREVDTKAMLEWYLKRHPEMIGWLEGEDSSMPRPLVWFDTGDDDDWEDWWPRDFGKAQYEAMERSSS